MRNFLLAICLSVMAPLITCARDVRLNWQDTANGTGVTYDAKRANGPCSPTPTFGKINPAPIPNATKTYLDSDVPFGTLSYVVTAVATVGGQPVESPPSNCVSVTITPSSPQSLTLVIVP